MPKRWSPDEEKEKKDELIELYVQQNKTISQIAPILRISPNSVYDRLIRLQIPIQKEKKPGFTKARILHVPPPSEDLAEFCGVMLGDGHLGTTQLFISINNKTDWPYILYLQELVERLFGFWPPVTAVNFESKVDLYVTSAHLMRELRAIGLYSSNKVRDQVSIPEWVFDDVRYHRGFVRGFFDTDGSIYRLKHFNAVQMSFNNRSMPLLEGTRQLLLRLGYHPSRFSGHAIYLTRQTDIKTYVQEIGFGNLKHLSRATAFGVAGALKALIS